MLAQLSAYADALQLASQPGFASKKVRWAVNVNSQGHFLTLEDLRVGGQGKEFPCCPTLSQPELLGGGPENPRSHFLVDSAEVVLEHARTVVADPAARLERRRRKRHHFIALLRKAGEQIGELHWLEAAARFLEKPLDVERARAELIKARGSAGDLVVVLVEGRNPLLTAAWHDWWRAWRETLTGAARQREGSRVARSQVRDFLSGELVDPLATHPKVKGLAGAGGQPSGDALISFDKPAFQSYGWRQGSNAPVSAESAARYVTALESLIGGGRQLAESKVCYWYSGLAAPESDPLAQLLDPSASAPAPALVVREGAPRFTCLVVSGCGGRLMVREWGEGLVSALQASVRAWFEDLSMVSPEGHMAPSPKLWTVLAALVRDPRTEICDPDVCDLLRRAAQCRPLPRRLLGLALERVRIDLLSSPTPDFQPARMGLIKAYLNRLPEPVAAPMSASLCPELSDAAYQSGRTLALLVEVERAAIPGIGGGNVQRWFPQASLFPARVLPRLLTAAQHHFRAARQRTGPLIASLVEQVRQLDERGGFPRALELNRQGVFALGFYQQLAEGKRRQREGRARATARSRDRSVSGEQPVPTNEPDGYEEECFDGPFPQI